MTYDEIRRYVDAVETQYMAKVDVMRMLYNMASGCDYIETDLRGAIENVRRAAALIIDHRRAEDEDS